MISEQKFVQPTYLGNKTVNQHFGANLNFFFAKFYFKFATFFTFFQLFSIKKCGKWLIQPVCCTKTLVKIYNNWCSVPVKKVKKKANKAILIMGWEVKTKSTINNLIGSLAKNS